MNSYLGDNTDEVDAVVLEVVQPEQSCGRGHLHHIEKTY